MSVVYQPRSALWWVLVVLGSIGTGSLVRTLLQLGSGSLLVGGLIVVVASVVCAAIILHFVRPLLVGTRVLGLGFGAGASIATWIALQGNQAFVFVYFVIPNYAEAWQPAIAGPFTEEWAKAVVILLVVLLTGVPRSPTIGLAIGGFVGLGFQTAENFVYVAHGAVEDPNSDLEGALLVAGLRFFIAIASHWVFSAFAGVGVILLLNRIFMPGVGLLALSYVWHFLWNTPLEMHVGLWIIVSKMVVILSAFVFFARWVRATEAQCSMPFAHSDCS